MNAKKETRQTDVAIVGAGPAALGLAYELITRGIETLCVAPALHPWAPTYGSWADELTGLDVPAKHVWARALVSFPRHQPVVLDRPYVRIDSASLFSRWSRALLGIDAFVSGLVSSAFFSGDFFELQLDSGASIRARHVFDASGHRPKLVQRRTMGPAFQTAFGADRALENQTLSDSTMGLMIWDDGLEIEGSKARTPAFSYVLPESSEIAFQEYTVLAARPMVDVELLEDRFVKEHGSREDDTTESERCIIPMGYPVPHLDQRIVGFGGAASMVHPATGYMVARVLRTAPVLADAYVAVRSLDVDERARALWAVVWPSDRVRTHELFQFGLEALLQMDVEQTHAFFAAFFELPDELWRPYQSGTASPKQVAEAMWRVFRTVDGPLKRTLVTTGFGRHAAKLLRLFA